MPTTIENYSPEATYIIYKLYRKDYVGDRQITAEGLKQISRSSAGAEFNASPKEVDELVEKLKKDNVITSYKHRDTWKLNQSFVTKHKQELEQMVADKSDVNRIL